MVTGARATITERDLQALRFTGEQYAIPMEVLPEVLGVPGPSGPRVARRTADRLARLGYADRRPLLWRQWLIPTQAGLRAAGLPYPELTPPEILLRHVVTVARLRLYFRHAEPEGVWECERTIREHWKGSRVRRADGALLWPDGGATGIEVELHVKKPARYAGILHDLDPAWGEVWWFTRANLVPLLTQRLADAGGGELHQVYPLPEGVSW